MNKVCTIFTICICIFILSCSSSKNLRFKKTPYLILKSLSIQTIDFQGGNKKLQGFTDDLLFEIARMNNIKIQIGSVANEKQAVQLLQRSQADGILSTMEPTPQNRKNFLFSSPYFVTGPVLVIREHDNFNLQTLINRIIGIERSNHWTALAIRTLPALYRSYDSINLAIEELLNYKIDGLIIDLIAASQLEQGLYNRDIKIASSPIIEQSLSLVTHGERNDELINAFNASITLMKENGTYKKLLNYWGLIQPEKNLIP